MVSFLKSFTRQIRDMPREMALILLAAIIANTASSAYYPFLPLYLETLGATVEQVGLFFTLHTIMAITFRVLGGWISDTLGRLQAIAISGVLGFLALLGFALAPTWQWAVVGAMFGMMGISLHSPSFQAYTAETASEGKTARTFGLVGSLFQICAIIGPLIGGFLVAKTYALALAYPRRVGGPLVGGFSAEQTSYQALLWTATGIFGVAALLRVWIARKSRFRFGTLKLGSLGRDVRFIALLLIGGGAVTWLFIIDGLHDAGFQMVFPFVPKYITEVGGQSEAMYGALQSGMAAVVALFTWVGGMLADRYGERWGIALGSLSQAAAFALMISFPNRLGFIVGFGLFGVGMAFIGPAIKSFMSKVVPKESLGMMFGLFWSALGVTAIPAPYIGGLLYDSLGPRVPIGVTVTALLFTALVALWKLRVPAEAAEPVEAGR